MSLIKVENWRTLSNNKNRSTKPENFRIKKKGAEQLGAKVISKPIPDLYQFYENIVVDPAQSNALNYHASKTDSLAYQLGGVNSGLFKLDHRLLQRLHSYGLSGSAHAADSHILGLTDFLQVKSVAFMSQDGPNKYKNVPVRQNRMEEKPLKPHVKKKTPSISDNGLLQEDELRKRNSCDAKGIKDPEHGASITQSVSKFLSPADSSTKDPNKEEAHTREYQLNNLEQDRSRSESPDQGKSGRFGEISSHKGERRNTTLTPRKENSVQLTKNEAFGSNRFGPLEKIQEINMKKSAVIVNSKNSPPFRVQQQFSNINMTTMTNNGIVNRTSQIQTRLASSDMKSEKIVSLNAVPISVHPNLIGATNQNFRASPPSKVRNGPNGNGVYKTTNSLLSETNNSLQADLMNNSNGLTRALLFNVESFNGGRKFQPGQTVQVVQQNVKLGRMLVPNMMQLPFQQASYHTSSFLLPTIINQSQLSQTTNATSLVSNGSALNLKPAAPSIRVDDQPRKKIVYVPPPQSNKYKFYVGAGNNSELVKRVLAKRDWWEPTEFFNSLFNLKWQQTYRGYKYDRLPDKMGVKQLVNHFEFHTEISTKDGLIKNLSTYCETNKMNLFSLTPVTFCFDMDDTANFDRDMQKFAKFFIKHHPDPKKYSHPDKKSQNVWYNFDYRKKPVYQHPSNHPEKKVSPFLKPIMAKTFVKDSNIWILKPVGLNRGRGIEVFNSLETLNELVNECLQPSSPTKKKTKKEEGCGSGSEDEEEDLLKKELSAKSRTFVIQKYIEDVLLINKRKFDIRVWALVTHDMQLYFFKEGYLRTSSEEFTLSDESVFNKFIHLTNNAVQKFSNGYGQHEQGNQLSFKDFEEYMAANGLEGDFRGKILPRMKELVRLSMQSVSKLLNQNDRKYCFEVFGYDFMIDAEFNVWLIEVNTNPCLDESSPLLHMLIPRMVDDAFKLSVDVIFPKQVKRQNTQPLQKASTMEIKKPINLSSQGSLDSHLKPIIKEEALDTKEIPYTKELEAEEGKGEIPGNEEPKEAGNINIVEKDEEKEAETPYDKKTSNENIPIQIVEPAVESKEEPVLGSPKSVKGEKPEEKPSTNVVFSVDGYSDTENMWEYQCSLYVPRSPAKRETKART